MVKPKELWAPQFYTESLSPNTKGPELAHLASNFLVASEGFRSGMLIELTEWQSWLVDQLLELDENGILRYKTALVMLPRKNGKTFLAAMLALYHLLRGPAFAEIYSAASTKDTAKIVFDMIIKWMKSNPQLSEILEVSKSKSSITNKITGAVYKPLAADGKNAHGFNPFFVVCDELHVWKNTELWDSLTTGSGARPESQVLAITTAGGDVDNSLLGTLYKAGKANAKEIYSVSSGFWAWEADEDDDLDSVDVWKKANPNLAEGLMDEKVIRAKMLEGAQGDFGGFMRYHLNIWSRLGGDYYIMPSTWEAAGLEDMHIPAGAKVTVGFDGSQSGDSTGIVVQDIETGHMEVWDLWEKPEGATAWFVDQDEVEESFKLLHQTYNVEVIWADQSYFQNSLVKWSEIHGWVVQCIPQTKFRMTPMGIDLIKAVKAKSVSHGFDERFTRYVMNASMREDGSYVKSSKTVKIDLLACAVLANGARDWLEEGEFQQEDAFIF